MLKLQRGVVAIMLKDDKGNLLARTTSRIACSNTLQVEAIVMKEGIMHTRSLACI